MVTPPILQAAIPKWDWRCILKQDGSNVPVDAVTATASGMVTYFLRKVLMISLSKTDFPVPALPV